MHTKYCRPIYSHIHKINLTTYLARRGARLRVININRVSCRSIGEIPWRNVPGKNVPLKLQRKTEKEHCFCHLVFQIFFCQQLQNHLSFRTVQGKLHNIQRASEGSISFFITTLVNMTPCRRDGHSETNF